MQFTTAILSLILIVTAQATTMGWKVPLEHLTSGLYPEYRFPDHRVPLLDKPPGKSAFFEKGDRLFDASEVVGRHWENWRGSDQVDPFADPQENFVNPLKSHPCDWIIWNERSSMLVAKGNAISLMLLDESLQIEGLPVRIETTVTLETNGGARELVSLSGRPGERMNAKSKALDVEVAPSLSRDRDLADITYQIEYHRPNSEIFTVSAATVMTNDAAALIAAWEENGVGWKIQLSWDAYTSYNVPFSKIQWMEDKGQLVTYEAYQKTLKENELGYLKIGDLLVRSFDVPPDFMQRISGVHQDNADPFDHSSLPDPLKGYLNRDLIDATEALRSNGVKFTHPKSFAFFSPMTSTLVVANDGFNMDLIWQIVGHGGCGQASTVSVAFNWNQGSAMLLARSGELASISSTIMDEEFGLFEIAPNIGANDRLIDLQFSLDPKSKVISLNSAVTLENGRETEVARYTDEEEEHAVTLKASISSHGH